jgi:hypothetical protein
MFTDGRHAGLIETNPFAGLRLRGSGGRKNLDVLTEAEVRRLCDCALEVWDVEVGLTMQALISVAAFVGARPSEISGCVGRTSTSALTKSRSCANTRPGPVRSSFPRMAERGRSYSRCRPRLRLPTYRDR